MAVWDRDRLPGLPGRHQLDIILPRRKLASRAYAPGPRAREGLQFKVPRWYVFNFTGVGQVAGTLGPRQASEARVVTGRNFYLLAIIATSTQVAAGGFRAQFYDARRKKRFSDRGINFANLAGSAQNPFLERRPYFIPAQSPILMRAQNLETVANQVQIVLYGVED